MTTMAALLGALPLALAIGPGSERRRPLGITIIGSLLVSQALTLYTTQVIYLLLAPKLEAAMRWTACTIGFGLPALASDAEGHRRGGRRGLHS